MGVTQSIFQSGLGTDYCLDIYQNSQDVGASVDIWNCNNGNNQTFIYDPKFKTVQAKNSNKCLGVSALAVNNPVTQMNCVSSLSTDYKNQAWTTTGNQIKPFYNQNLCLDVRGGSGNNGAQAQLSLCNGSISQVWKSITPGTIIKPTVMVPPGNQELVVPEQEAQETAQEIIYGSVEQTEEESGGYGSQEESGGGGSGSQEESGGGGSGGSGSSEESKKKGSQEESKKKSKQEANKGKQEGHNKGKQERHNKDKQEANKKTTGTNFREKQQMKQKTGTHAKTGTHTNAPSKAAQPAPQKKEKFQSLSGEDMYPDIYSPEEEIYNAASHIPNMYMTIPRNQIEYRNNYVDDIPEAITGNMPQLLSPKDIQQRFWTQQYSNKPTGRPKNCSHVSHALNSEEYKKHNRSEHFGNMYEEEIARPTIKAHSMNLMKNNYVAFSEQMVRPEMLYRTQEESGESLIRAHPMVRPETQIKNPYLAIAQEQITKRINRRSCESCRR